MFLLSFDSMLLTPHHVKIHMYIQTVITIELETKILNNLEQI